MSIKCPVPLSCDRPARVEQAAGEKQMLDVKAKYESSNLLDGSHPVNLCVEPYPRQWKSRSRHTAVKT